MLALVKNIIDLWEVRKIKLYGEPCSAQPQSQSSAGDPRDGTVVGGQRRGECGKFSHSGIIIVNNECIWTYLYMYNYIYRASSPKQLE